MPTKEVEEKIYFFTVIEDKALSTYLCRAFSLEEAFVAVRKDHAGKEAGYSGMTTSRGLSEFLTKGTIKDGPLEVLEPIRIKDLPRVEDSITPSIEQTLEAKTEAQLKKEASFQIKSMVKFLKAKGYSITKKK